MLFTASEDFSDASRRHLADADVLAAARRWDGVVHLAGFAAECAIKAVLGRVVGPGFCGRDLGHDLEGMSSKTWAWTAAVTGDRQLSHALRAVQEPALVYMHPDRRYWARGWSEQEAGVALEAARTVVQAEILEYLMDSGEPWGED